MTPTDPIQKLIWPYYQKYQGLKGYFTKDKRTKSFFAYRPLNDDPQDTLLKVVETKDAQLVAKGAALPMSRHILALGIDQALGDRDLAVVDAIAMLPLKNGTQRFIGFASRYCNLHQPSTYPVWSDPFKKLLVWHGQLIGEDFGMATPTLDYAAFKQAADDLMARVGQPGLDYQSLHKLLWLYGEEIDKACQQAPPNKLGVAC